MGVSYVLMTESIVPWAKPHEITKGLQQMTGIGKNGVLDFFHKT